MATLRLPGARGRAPSPGLDLIPGQPFGCGWHPASSFHTDLRVWLWGSIRYRHRKPHRRAWHLPPGATIIFDHEEPTAGSRALEKRPRLPLPPFLTPGWTGYPLRPDLLYHGKSTVLGWSVFLSISPLRP